MWLNPVQPMGSTSDILKIEDEISYVWTDSGSVVFGLDLSELAALVFDAALDGAKQFRDIVGGFTPESIQTFFRLFNRASQSVGGEPLDESITRPDVMDDAIRNYAGTTVSVDIPSELTPEQINGINMAIPQIADITHRGWNLSTIIQNSGSHQMIRQTIVLANNVHIALPPGEATDAAPGDRSPTSDS